MHSLRWESSKAGNTTGAVGAGGQKARQGCGYSDAAIGGFDQGAGMNDDEIVSREDQIWIWTVLLVFTLADVLFLGWLSGRLF